MIGLSAGVKQLHYRVRVRLNKGFQSDLRWWAQFLASWNGVGKMQRRKAPLQITLTSDASGSWGCGAYTSKGERFSLKWPDSWVKIHITVKELLPIVMGVATVQLDLNLNKNRVWCCTHTQYVRFQPRLALRVHAKLLTQILLAGTSRVSTRVPDVPSRACIIEYLKGMQHESTCARELSL